MEKDFDSWNKYKKVLDSKSGEVLFHEREIWWCSIGLNIGSEQHSQTADFSRPVLIYKCWATTVFWGIPLTTKVRNITSRYKFILNGIENDALILQMRAFDSRRLIRKINMLEEIEFATLSSFLIGSLVKSKTEPATSAGSSEAEATV